MTIKAKGSFFGPKKWTSLSVITALALLFAITFPIIDPRIMIGTMAPNVVPIPFWIDSISSLVFKPFANPKNMDTTINEINGCILSREIKATNRIIPMITSTHISYFFENLWHHHQNKVSNILNGLSFYINPKKREIINI